MRFLSQPLKFFKEYIKRRKKKDHITYEEYLNLDKKVALDSSGKPNPRLQKSIERKLETFGERIYEEIRFCPGCGRDLLLLNFPVRWDQNNRIEVNCIDCETKRKSKYT